ncbi:MAG: hypothetical protein S4CHLAM123_00300 [Chlamydiales bacterium]|nr:hypothetical protein [Chlamydiales bacterium]
MNVNPNNNSGTFWNTFAAKLSSSSSLCSNLFQTQFPLDPENLSKREINVVPIPADGNCAFQAVLTELENHGINHGIQDMEHFRNKTADWMAENIFNDEELRAYIIQSAQEYLEVSLEKLLTEEDELTFLATNFDSIKSLEINLEELIQRIDAIVQKKQKIQADLAKIENFTNIYAIALIVSEYLQSIRSNIDTERVHASRAHYYAFTKIFDAPIKLNVYMERKNDYLLLDRQPNVPPPIEINLLHVNGNHIDLLQKK